MAEKKEKQIPFGNDRKKSKGREAKRRDAAADAQPFLYPPLRIIAIDWSGRIDVAGQRRHIWAGVWTRDSHGKVTVKLEAGRTRDEMGDWLIEVAHETPRVVVGIDCCFSFPAWFLQEHGCDDMFAFWRKANGGLAEQWLVREGDAVARDERFWGKPHKRPAQFSGEGYRSMFRFADYDNKIAQALAGGDIERAAKMRGITPKSPFQIGGSGSVGTGSLRAMPMLAKLHDAGFRIWPLEASAIDAKQPKPLLTEMYTRLMTGAVAKSNANARKQYLAQKHKTDPLYATLSRSVAVKALASEDAFDALVSMYEMARHAETFGKLRATRDPELRREGLTWRPGL